MNPACDEASQILGIVRPDTQCAAIESQNYAITTPEIPDPASSEAQVNAPAVEDGCSPNFGALDVFVLYRTPEHWDGAEADRQSVASILNGEMMKRGGEDQDQQADYREGPQDRRFVSPYRSQNE